MWRSLRKWWKYLGAKLGGKLEEVADPKVQLEQAIQEARDQHRKLTEQAANVIANQKQTQLRLDRAIEEYEKTRSSAGQALLLTDQETRDGNADKAANFGQAAESFATKMITLEQQIEDLKKLLLDTTKAAASAKAAVAQNSAALQQKLSEREKLLSELDQAKMHEQMNAAMAQLNATVGDDVPTFEEVRRKIDTRLARAQGMAELTGTTVDSHMLEVEQAQASAEAQARISELRSELGIVAPTPPAPAVDAAPTELEAGS
jgi:phage shock protein A